MLKSIHHLIIPRADLSQLTEEATRLSDSTLELAEMTKNRNELDFAMRYVKILQLEY